MLHQNSSLPSLQAQRRPLDSTSFGSRRRAKEKESHGIGKKKGKKKGEGKRPEGRNRLLSLPYISAPTRQGRRFWREVNPRRHDGT